MASLFMGSCKILLFLILFTSFQLVYVDSVEFKVGDDKGWVVPSSKNDQFYNDWASRKRFQVGDSVRFKYTKDSVLVVTNFEYDKCHSARPIFLSKNADTIFKFNHPGLFYFISGVAEHCERGQKMIIKVLKPEHSPLTDSSNHSSAVKMAAISAPVVMAFIISFLGFLFIDL